MEPTPHPKSALVFVAPGPAHRGVWSLYGALCAGAAARFPSARLYLTTLGTAAASRGRVPEASEPELAAMLPALKAQAITRVALVPLHLVAGVEFARLTALQKEWAQANAALQIQLGHPLLADRRVLTNLCRELLRLLSPPLANHEALVMVAHGTTDPRGAAMYAAAADVARQFDRRLLLAVQRGHPHCDTVSDICRREGWRTARLLPFALAGGTTTAEISDNSLDGSWHNRLQQHGIVCHRAVLPLSNCATVVEHWLTQAAEMCVAP